MLVRLSKWSTIGTVRPFLMYTKEIYMDAGAERTVMLAALQNEPRSRRLHRIVVWGSVSYIDS